MKYGVTDIVIIVARITVEKIGASSTPKETPSIPIIRENSESCANEIEVKKLVFALYPVILRSINVIIGFIKNAPTINEPKRRILSPIPINTICIPRATKKRIAKKSLNGTILDSSSILNGEFARETPAMKAPITIDSSAKYERIMNKKSTANEDKNRSSVERAANLKSLFNKYFCRKIAVAKIADSFRKANEMGISENPPVVKITIAIIAIRSCKRRIPRTNLP